MRQLYSGSGQCLSIGGELGRGGEGAVFAVRENPHQVVKLYQRPLSPEHQAKLTTMVSMRTDQLSKIAAWPMDSVRETTSGPIIGFTMPRVTGFKPIHTLYGPKSRISEFPSADWSFVMHTAANLARAFGVLHGHGIVIGDVNHDNAVVSAQGTVMLWDCDSFQVAHSGRVFRCEVGVPTHTPPELQGQSFKGVTRTLNHDAFGLAVLIFQLLFLGRHPYAGVYLGPGDMPLERAIQGYRFAYGSQASAFQMKAPPAVPPISIVGAPLAGLFEIAFGPSGSTSRPGPNQWVTELTSLLDRLARCKLNPAHVYPSSVGYCPWCRVESQSGIVTFGLVIRKATSGSTQGNFDIEAVWATILRVPGPGVPPSLPEPSTYTVQQTPEAAQAAQKRDTGRAISWTIAVVVFAAVWYASGSFLLALALGIAIVWAGSAIAGEGTSDLEKQLRLELSTAERQLRDLRQRWDQEASAQPYQSKMQHLEGARMEHLRLGAVRNQKLRDLQSNLRQRQLEKFLDTRRIDHASIPGIGPARKATLQSWGIETAYDVTRRSIGAVPGFGPSLTSRLMDWRSEQERKFVFNPSQGPDPADIAALERDLALTRGKLEQDLLRGVEDLRSLSQQIQNRRRSLLPLIENASRAVAQGRANLKGF